MTRTQWFCCTTPPVNLGVYEYRIKPVEGVTPVYMGRYEGADNWCGPSTSGVYALLLGLTLHDFREGYEWRGLAIKPKAKP